jgi:hypothetical protein
MTTMVVEEGEENRIECMICGKKYRRLDNGHLSRVHNITNEEYIEQFPNAKLIADSCYQLLVEHCRENIKLGLNFTSEALRKNSEGLKQAWNEGKFDHLTALFKLRPRPKSENLTRGLRIYYGWSLCITDGNGQCEVLKLVKKRNDEKPIAQWNGGEIYKDSTIFPCTEPLDLQKLIIRWALPLGFSPKSIDVFYLDMNGKKRNIDL